ncbi:MAG TPA: carboxy terminal-processing peptidase [Chryseolinea sp.]|nr:carboxy terminal-processing peptidase [Chryseolinea sp.]
MTRSLLIVLLFSTLGMHAQPSRLYEGESKRLIKTLHERHVAPRTINDDFSKYLFDHIIRQVDPESLYFTAMDIASLSAQRERLDDELLGSSPWTFLPRLSALYKTCLERYRNGIDDVAKVSIDFNRRDAFTSDTTWAPDLVRLKEKWSLEFRHKTFSRLYDKLSRKKDQSEKEFLLKNEQVTREQVHRVMLRNADKYLASPNGVDEHIAIEFLNSITSSFDPHSSYFSPQMVAEFMAALSSKGAYYGITLEENEDGEVCITQLMPGGSAWKSGEIFVGDVITEIQFESLSPIDLWGFSVEDVVKILDESNKNSMNLVLRTADGISKSVALHKEVVDAEENVVKSFVLSGNKKIGFISLPAFYSTWGDADGSHCANDVAREIVKLKRENVDGIILDLRFNGGGVMDESIAMAGIFIDAGPIVAVRNKNGEITTMKDVNRGTIYDGPLIVMVNRASASASELLAAALQDYHRAVIVGATTYGKGTAQQIISTSTANGTPTATKTLHRVTTKAEDTGFVSITFERFYRVTGKTNQFVGVVPDVVMPDALAKMEIGEKFMPGAFAPDSIQKKIYYQPLRALPVDSLVSKSARRQAANSRFEEVNAYGEWLSKGENRATAALDWTAYKQQRVQEGSMMAGLKKTTSVAVPSFKVARLTPRENAIQADAFADGYNNRWISHLEQDVFLDESFNIMCDLIKIVGK